MERGLQGKGGELSHHRPIIFLFIKFKQMKGAGWQVKSAIAWGLLLGFKFVQIAFLTSAKCLFEKREQQLQKARAHFW